MDQVVDGASEIEFVDTFMLRAELLAKEGDHVQRDASDRPMPVYF